MSNLHVVKRATYVMVRQYAHRPERGGMGAAHIAQPGGTFTLCSLRVKEDAAWTEDAPHQVDVPCKACFTAWRTIAKAGQR